MIRQKRAGAKKLLTLHGFSDRADFAVGDGLLVLPREAQAIAILGMGGYTIAGILENGRELLQGAALILSAHTDLPLIREAVSLIGYHTDREEPCFCAGRFYLVLRARPGARATTEKELRLGGPLFESASDQLIPYLKRRREVLENSLKGLLSAESPDRALIGQVREDIRAYDDYIEKGLNPHDRTGSV